MMRKFERGGGQEEMESTYALVWSLVALALSLTGIKKASMGITLVIQSMNLSTQNTSFLCSV